MPTHSTPNTDHDWMQKVESIIQLHLNNNEELTVEGVIARLAISRTSFYQKVKRITGHTPARLLQTSRMKRAYHLLTTLPQTKVTDIAHAVGLTDTKNFTALFKKHYQITPNQLKKQQNLP